MYYKKSHKYESRRDFFEARINLLKKEINQLSKNEILNIDENSYIDYLEDKYSLEPLCVYRDNEIIHEPTPISKEVENPYDSIRYVVYGHKMICEGYRIEVSYPFSGDAILFNVCPNSFVLSEDNLLEFIGDWMSDGYRPKKLFNLLREKYLLVIGCNYPDWLFRFFFRRGLRRLRLRPIHHQASLQAFQSRLQSNCGYPSRQMGC